MRDNAVVISGDYTLRQGWALRSFPFGMLRSLYMRDNAVVISGHYTFRNTYQG